MGTNVRAELSGKNKYWISKHRYYELKHFCLQYPSWKKAYVAIGELTIQSSVVDDVIISMTNKISDPTGNRAVARTYYWEKMMMIERTAQATDPDLWIYILKAVTEDLSYNHLKTRLEMPCSKDMYYDRYRKFFWLLSRERD